MFQRGFDLTFNHPLPFRGFSQKRWYDARFVQSGDGEKDSDSVYVADRCMWLTGNGSLLDRHTTTENILK